MCLDVGVDLCGIGYPSFAFGWLNLQAVFGKCADPDGPHLVEQDGVAGYDHIINVGENGDELSR